MEPEHWIQRWQEGRIGFHQGSPNRWLQQFLPELSLTEGDYIFLPLCGKSVDLPWLAKKGLSPLGVELSPIAIQHFFQEQQLQPLHHSLPNFESWQYISSKSSITLLEGDFFQLTPELTGHCRAVFDRAALVALPPEMRRAYVDHLSTLLTAGTEILLVTTEFPQEQKSPPPFSVSDSEVQNLYGGEFQVEPLHSENLSESGDPLTRRGVTSLTERIYRMIRK